MTVLISQMPRFRRSSFSIFQLCIFLFLLCIFVLLYFYIFAFLHFPFSLKNMKNCLNFLTRSCSQKNGMKTFRTKLLVKLRLYNIYFVKKKIQRQYFFIQNRYRLEGEHYFVYVERTPCDSSLPQIYIYIKYFIYFFILFSSFSKNASINQ